mgnify:FL=1
MDYLILIAVLQRVKDARVDVANKTVGKIGKGLLILIGVFKGDDESDSEFLARKISSFRIFQDDKKNMNLSVLDIGGSALVVSQFTLCADWRRGNRPGFSSAALPEKAKLLYEHFMLQLKHFDVPVESGTFGAAMDVQLNNEGPVTFVLDSREK